MSKATMPTNQEFVEHFENYNVDTDFFENFICNVILPDSGRFKKYEFY